jgi:hypothetical protein
VIGKFSFGELERRRCSEVQTALYGTTAQLSSRAERLAAEPTVAQKAVLFQDLPEVPKRNRMARIAVAGSRLRTVLLVALLLLLPRPATAAVEITFYSKEFGTTFPHAFVLLKGELDESGEKIEANYGFTATHVSPAILMGSVQGEVLSLGQGYVSKSDPHFSITLSDAEYRQVMATVEQWQSLKQPSYNLNRQNCVFFVARVAAALGMTAETPKELMKKPRSYLQFLKQENQAWLETRNPQLAER